MPAEKWKPAERLLRDFGGFAGLMTMSAQELSRIHGIGPAKLEAYGEQLLRLLAS